MGHIVNAKEEVYRALAERLSKTPEGAPLNEDLMAILYSLYTENEAYVGSKFSFIPMPLKKIAEVTGMAQDALKAILDEMSAKGLLIDLPRKDTYYYLLAPMMVGFFEYTFMRAGDGVKLKELADLFERYFQRREVAQDLFGVDTKIMRSLIYENLIPLAVETEVLDYEKATEIVRQAGGGAISLCACRHEASHLGKACDAPQEVCLTLGGAAEWIIRKRLGKAATVEELLAVLTRTRDLGLVHLCDNVLNKPTYICSCCGCCCHVLRGISEQNLITAHPSNFIPTVDFDSCLSCGLCADKCHIKAIVLTEQDDGQEMPVIRAEICLGCGVCVSVCPSVSLSMSRRAVPYIPPKDIKAKLQKMAAEKGRLL